jgi:hypothetical protein
MSVMAYLVRMTGRKRISRLNIGVSWRREIIEREARGLAGQLRQFATANDRLDSGRDIIKPELRF